LLGRLGVAAYFLGFGWYLAALIGAVGLSWSTAGLRSAERRIGILIAASGIVLLAGVCTYPYFASEMAISTGAGEESAGHPDQAIGLYRKAIALYGWYRVNLDLYERIGAIDSALGRTQTFEYRIYHAETLAARDDLPAAIYGFESLAVADPPRAAMLRARAADLRTLYGAELYITASFGAAVDAWQRALQEAPNLWLAAFYLTRGEFAVGRYRDSVDMGRRLVTQLADPVLLANLYSNLGDCYTRLGELPDARDAYRRSWHFANKLNWRSLSALAGS
jgi:tetratricopeptide (TPR) repeat protein